MVKLLPNTSTSALFVAHTALPTGPTCPYQFLQHSCIGGLFGGVCVYRDKERVLTHPFLAALIAVKHENPPVSCTVKILLTFFISNHISIILIFVWLIIKLKSTFKVKFF